jgi:site-specific recombinase XerD
LPWTAAPKEATVDTSIRQFGQDLALAGYAKKTQARYVRTAEHLASRFGRPLARLTREELRTYVEELAARGRSGSWVNVELCALRFLYRKTLGQPERVSFISYPRRHRPLPTILSLEEIGALIAVVSMCPTSGLVGRCAFGCGTATERIAYTYAGTAADATIFCTGAGGRWLGP